MRVNLAALTAEELHLLLGGAAAQRVMPEVNAARLGGRGYPGPALSEHLHFEALEERDWGATPERARQLQALRGELLEAGAQELGVFYLKGFQEARHQRAFALQDTALALRWSETPSPEGSEGGHGGAPFLVAASLLRDRASGSVAVLSATAATPFALTQSEEIDARVHEGASVRALLESHRQGVLRHGRAARIQGEADWQRTFVAVRELNLTAWRRRGLLLDEAVAGR